MRTATENEFFYLTFGQYIGLNQRQTPSLAILLDGLRSSENYDDLRVDLFRAPIERQEDADFIAGLKALMDPIEKMRNCIAHSRRPDSNIAGNFPSASLRLEEHMDDYLTRKEL